MVHSLVIDVKRIYEDFHKNEINTNTFLMCYSLVEHTLLDLGYQLDTFTNDIRKQPFNTLSKHFIEAIEHVITTFTLGIEPSRKVCLSVYKCNKSLLIVVRE